MGETSDLEAAIGSTAVDIFSGPTLSSWLFINSMFSLTSVGGVIWAVGLEGTDSSSEG